MDVCIAVLGPVSVTVDDVLLPLRRKEAAIIGTLALRIGSVLSADQLGEAVWGRADEDFRSAVQVQVSRLRRALGSAGGVVTTRGRGYRLDLAFENVDVTRFEAALIRAREAAAMGDLTGAVTAAEEALALWRGQVLDGGGEGWAALERLRLEESRLLAEEIWSEALLVLEPRRAAVELEPLACAEPLRERRWWLLASALGRSGRQADALRAINRARRVLRDELGVQPGPDLVTLERRLLDQDPAAMAAMAAPASARKSRTLPVPISRFIGRDAELTDLVAVCGASRLVTLTGTGGTGKSRLALALAERLALSRCGGVWLVELDKVHDDRSVADLVAAHVAPLGEGREPLQRAADALKTEPSMIVLDSCEHVLAGAATTAAALLTNCPDLLVVATSREPLGIAGEINWLVPPLALHSDRLAGHSDAVALLVDRASAANPRLDLSDWTDELETVARAVDGLPLALELAAARLRAIDPAQLAEALSRRLGILVGHARGGAARHSTMRAALDYSAAMCTSVELTVLARCSVFRDGFSADAAVAVSSAGEPPIEGDAIRSAIEALVSRSIMTSVDGRFALLEPVRQWAEERLDQSGDTTVANVAHGAWATSLAVTAGRGTPSADPVRLAAEHANLMVAMARSIGDGSDRALRIVGAVGHRWAASGQRDTLSWAVDALAADPGVPPVVRMRALIGTGQLASVVPDPKAAVSLQREAVELAYAHATPRQLGWAVFNLAKELMLATRDEGGGLDEARRTFSDALTIFDGAVDQFGEAWAAANLGYLALAEGDDRLAGEWYERAEAIARPAPFPHVLAVLDREQAVLASRRGDHARARINSAASIASYREQNDLWQLCNALSIGAEVSWVAGAHQEAIDRADEALAIASTAGYGDNIRLTTAWVAHRALDAGLQHDAAALGAFILDSLEQRAQLWPTTAAAVRALREAFPALHSAKEGPPATGEVARQARRCLVALRRPPLAERPA